MSNLLRVTGIQGAARMEPSRGLVLAAAGAAIQGTGGFGGPDSPAQEAQSNLSRLSDGLAVELDIANAMAARVQSEPEGVPATLKDLVLKGERQLTAIRAGSRITMIQGIQAAVATLQGALL